MSPGKKPSCSPASTAGLVGLSCVFLYFSRPLRPRLWPYMFYRYRQDLLQKSDRYFHRQLPALLDFVRALMIFPLIPYTRMLSGSCSLWSVGFTAPCNTAAYCLPLDAAFFQADESGCPTCFQTRYFFRSSCTFSCSPLAIIFN